MDSSHGAGLAVIVPHWMRHVYKVNVPRFAQWANRVMDVEINPADLEGTALEGIDRLSKFIKEVGLPTTLADLGVKDAAPERLMEVARLACADTDTLHNMPFPVTPESVYAAIAAADQLGRCFA